MWFRIERGADWVRRERIRRARRLRIRVRLCLKSFDARAILLKWLVMQPGNGDCIGKRSAEVEMLQRKKLAILKWANLFEFVDLDIGLKMARSYGALMLKAAARCELT